MLQFSVKCSDTVENNSHQLDSMKSFHSVFGLGINSENNFNIHQNLFVPCNEINAHSELSLKIRGKYTNENRLFRL